MTDRPAADPAASLCPLCQQPNQCAMAGAQPSSGPCWCTTMDFSTDLLARVPAAWQGKACICAACAAAQPAAAAR